jgi:hypothetical protein
MELSDDHEGKLFDICLNIWEKTEKRPSVRFNAFRLMVKILKKHPELSREMRLLTESPYTDSLSAAVKKSISKMTAGFNNDR